VIDSVTLAPTDVTTTRLGFGCGALMQVASRKDRQAVLGAAYESGVRHFDVARMYGLGAAEGELSRFLATHRDGVTVATKYGIDAVGASSGLARIQAPARALLARSQTLRRVVKSRASAFEHPRRYDAECARASLDQSLAQLRTDHVDLFFLHEPLDATAVQIDEVRAHLESERQRGRIRAWGVAGEPEPSRSLTEALGREAVLQVRDDVLQRRDTPLPSGRALVTFGVVSSALRRIREHLSEDPVRRARWNQVLGFDAADAEAVAALLLSDAALANPVGVVLFSTTSPRRAARVATVAPDPESVRGLRSLVAEMPT
jgi:D-threo-aldose 1-dehydrogenase